LFDCVGSGKSGDRVFMSAGLSRVIKNEKTRWAIHPGL